MSCDAKGWWSFCLSGKTPAIDKVLSIIFGIINIILPGIGLLIAALIEGADVINYTFIVLIQLFLCWLVLPWIWAIVLGVRMIACPGN